jgi:hypothetical protein
MNKIELFLSDPRYQQLDQAGKQKALDKFFYKYVPLDSRYQQLDQAGRESAYNTFIGKYLGVQTQAAEQPKPQTFRDKLSAKTLGVDINKETAQAVSTVTADTQKAQFFKSDPMAGYEAGKAKAKEIYGDNKVGFIGDLVSGFAAGAKQIFAAPEIWGNYLAGNKYRAQELQGMIDEQLSQAGYNNMDMVGAIKKGDIKAVAGMALRTTAQSAPATIAWLLRNYAGDVASFSSASSAKLMQLDREHPELSKGKTIASAINAGFWEAAMEEMGNRIVFLNKYVKNLRALPKAVLTKTIAKEIAKTGVKNIAKELGISMAVEGFEEVGTFTAEYIADTLLGIHEFDPKEFALGNLNSGLLGASGGLVQGGAVTGYMSVRSASMLNLKSKLENAANLDLSKYKDAKSWNVAKNLKQLAANTKTAVQMAEDGDAEGAAELAYENLSAAQRNLESTGLRSFSGIGSYNAILIDAISDYSTEEEGIDIKENIATRKLANIVNNIAAGQEPVQSLKTIKQAVQIAEMSNKKADIDKAAQALAEIDQTKLNDKDKEAYKAYTDTIAKLQQATGEVKKVETPVRPKPVVAEKADKAASEPVAEPPKIKKAWEMTQKEMLSVAEKDYLKRNPKRITGSETKTVVDEKTGKEKTVVVKYIEEKTKITDDIRKSFIELHKSSIISALKRGDNVSPEVLAEYPGLTAETVLTTIEKAKTPAKPVAEVKPEKAVEKKEGKKKYRKVFEDRESSSGLKEVEAPNAKPVAPQTEQGASDTKEIDAGEAEIKVLKKELSDIYNTLSLLKEEHDRLLKIAPDNRTAEQDKRIEYIDELSKVMTIRKSEIEREIAGIKTPPKEAVTPAPEAVKKVYTFDSNVPKQAAKFMNSQQANLTRLAHILSEIQKAKDEGYTHIKVRGGEYEIDEQLNKAKEKLAEAEKNYVFELKPITTKSEFQAQWRKSQPKLTPEQLDTQLEVVDALMQTFATEMGVTLDDAYATVSKIGTEKLKDSLNQEDIPAKPIQNFHTMPHLFAASVKDYAKKMREWKEKITLWAETMPDVITFKTAWGYQVVSKDTTRQNKNKPWRVTSFDAEYNPMGHGIFATKAQAVIDAAKPIGHSYDPSILFQDLMAQIKFRTDGKAEIAFLKPDITSGLHEISHLGRVFLSVLAQHDTTGKWQAVMKDAETWAGVKDGKWTTEAEEKFAKGFEKYLYEGNAPTAKLKTAFEKIKQWMAKLIDRIAGIDAVQLDDRIRSVYGMMLGAEKVKVETAKKSLSDIKTKYGFTGKEALRKGIIVANTTITKRGGERVLSYSASNLGMSDFDTMMEAIDAYYTEKARRESLLSEVVLGTMEGKANYFELFKGDNKLYARVYSANGIVKDYSKTEWESKLWEIQNLVYLGEDRDGNKIGKYSGEQIDKYKYNLPEKYVKYNGMYVDSNIHSVAKQPLTSQQKVAVVKIKADMAGKVGSDPVALEKHLDRYINDKFKNLTMEAERKQGVYSLSITDVDTGNVLVEIAHKDGTYEINEFFAQDNADAIAKIEELLASNGNVLNQDYGDSPQEQYDAVKKQYAGTAQWLKAPNGKPTNLNERQWLQVRTPNFKAWFGDWENDPKNASKVVDENGEPLVLYHGSNSLNILTEGFKKEKLGSKNIFAESARMGFFFAETRNTAENYTGLDGALASGLIAFESPEGLEVASKYKAEVDDINKKLSALKDSLFKKYREKHPYWKKISEVIDFYKGMIPEEKIEEKKAELFRIGINEAEKGVSLKDIYDKINKNKNILAWEKRLAEISNESYTMLEKLYFENRPNLSPTIYEVFISSKNPFVKDYNGSDYRDEAYSSVIGTAIKLKHDGVFLQNTFDGADEDNIYVVFEPEQIKSATANTGEFNPTQASILNQMVEDAAPEKQQALKDKIAAQAKKARKAQVTARRLRYKMGSTANVGEWNNFMRKSLTTLIRTMHPGATPINEQWVEALHYQFLDAQAQGDEDLMKSLKRKVERMKKADAKFRRYLSHYSGGYEDVAYIPFEQLFIAIQAISPSTYNHLVSGNTPQVILDLIPKLKQEFGDKYMDAIGWLVHYTHLGSSPYTGASEFGKFAMQPHRLLARIMGKAGVELVGLGYQAGIQNRLYEHGYEPFLSRVHKMLLSPENNRGAVYMGEEIDYIGKTIVEVVNDLGIEPEQQKAEISKRIEEWNAKEESIINVQDVIDIYDASMDLMDLFKDYITEWNANPKHEKAKIGILENYLPRSYRGEDISSVVDKIGDSFLYRSKNAKRREKEELSKTRLMENNMFILLRNYAYEMSKYMAFYDFAEYATQQITRIDKDRIVKRGSLMDQDISFLQKHTSGSVRDYVRNYIRDTIGYYKAQKGWDRFISSARTNAYSNALSLNLLMTALNWHQRWLIYSVVDRNVADYVRNDIQFWTGNTKMSEQMYPMLSEIMEQYKIHNLSLLADMLAEAKSMQSIGSTKASRAYYEATAFNAKILQTSPFSRAEYGNRAWAHAAGVYQVLMNSPEYKQAMQTQGMTRHGAMEIALQNPQLRDAAIRYGGIINAEVNADVNSSFAPSLFRNSSGIKHILTFMRYSNTILLLKLRTYGGVFRKLKSELSPDIFNLLTSGDTTAINDAQLIQLAEMMKQFTSSKRVDKLIKDGYISRTPGKGLITVDQMRSINEAISWALDTYVSMIKADHANIVRSTKDKLERAAQLLGFDLAETMIRLLYAFLAGLIPWWMGRKTKIDPEMITLMALQNVLPLRSMSYSLGQGILPDIPVYNMDNPKVISKEITKKGMAITPYFGQINAASKIFTGKYISDIAWDEITEK